MTATPAVAAAVVLRPPVDGEPRPDSSSEWDDWGPFERNPHFEVWRLLVVADGEVAGEVTWHREMYGPNAGSQVFNIGIGLVGAFRGRGIGAVAQRMLAEHLFATTSVHRVEASTDVRNVAEQRSLEKAGFTREGVLRGAQFRSGGWHDLVSYAVLRTDL